ncbi:MAG: NAD-dependent deacylase [Dehalococcoidia bacterium]|nr:NAD-dependent deacylase [Dehalococcoidia bacterium]
MEKLIQLAAKDILVSKYVIALTGAGISTESAIPDFRGPKGLWTTDKKAEARAYERYELFLTNPGAYWEEMMGTGGAYGEFYGKIREAEPNPGHHALAELEGLGILKCVVTQNIDGLHVKAGNRKVWEYHGSVSRLRCVSCGARFDLDEVSLDELPPRCRCGAPLKYDVVHFKEPIPSDVMEESEKEALRCDLMLVCGTSAVVYPFASLPRVAKFRRGIARYGSLSGESTANVKIIEVNAEPTSLTCEGISDYFIQGKTGEILPAIVEEVKRIRSDCPGDS